MAGASSYPNAIDTSATLPVVLSTTTALPSLINNVQDAATSLELTVGVADDGTANGGTQSFQTGVNHLVPLLSTAMPNPRYPLVVPNGSSWYAVNGTPASPWSMPSAATFDVASCKGLAHIHQSAVPGLAAASVPLPFVGANYVYARVRLAGDSTEYGPAMEFGLSTTCAVGTAFQWCEGGAWSLTNYVTPLRNTGTFPASNLRARWLYVCMGYDTGYCLAYVSGDGQVWDKVSTIAVAVAPTAFNVYVGRNMAGTGDGDFWVDQMAWAQVAPAAYVAV